MAKPKILIIDDDEDVLCASKTVLAANDYEVVCARNGESGLASAAGLRPALVILDIIMSPDDGLTIAERLKEDARTAHIPVLVISAVAEKLHKRLYSPEIASRLKAERFLQKPIEPQVLLREVAALVNPRHDGSS